MSERPHVHRVLVKGTEMHCQEAGTGDLLIVVHDSFSDVRSWGVQISSSPYLTAGRSTQMLYNAHELMAESLSKYCMSITEKLVPCLGRAGQVVIPTASHRMHAHYPLMYDNTVLKFLSRH